MMQELLSFYRFLLYYGAMKISWLILACLPFVSMGADITFADGLLRRGFYAQAAKEYEQLAKSASVALRLGECYERLGRMEEAREQYLLAQASSNKDEQVIAATKLAGLLMEKQCYAEAVPLLEKASTLPGASKDQQAGAWYRLGLCYESMGSAKEAKTLYQLLLKGTSPFVAGARIRLGSILLTEGDANGAEQLFAQITDGSANLLLAWAAFKATHYSVAQQALAAEQLRSSQPTAERLYLQGKVSEAMGMLTAAREAYEGLLQFPEKNTYVQSGYYELLRLLWQAKDETAFLTVYKQVVTQLDDSARVQIETMRLSIALSRGDLEMAASAANYVMARGTEMQAAEAGYRLGWLLQRQSQWLGAAAVFERVYTQWPNATMAGQAAYAAAYAFNCGAPTSTVDVSVRMDAALTAALAAKDATIVSAALMLRARQFLAKEDRVAAGLVLDELLQRFPQDAKVAEAYYLRGLIFFQSGDYRAAEQSLAQAVSHEGLGHDERVEAILRRAQALYELDEKATAADLLQPLLGVKAMASLPGAYLKWLVEFRLARGENEAALQAVRVLKQRQGTPSDRALAEVLQGRIEEALGHSASALAAYQQALQQASGSLYEAEAALGVGRCLMAAKAFDQAAEAFEQAINLSSMDTPEGRKNRLLAYEGLAKSSEALGDQERALRANMNMVIFFDDAIALPQAFARAIALLTQLGRTQEAETLRKELEIRYPIATVKEH